MPSSAGAVLDFAVGPDALYPIEIIGGRYQLVRCPQFSCSGTPQVIGEVGSDTNGRGVAIVGAHVFWIGTPAANGDAQIMQADLDGSHVSVRTTLANGELEPPLRSDDFSLYFNFASHSTHAAQVYSLTAAYGSPTLISDVSATSFGLADHLDVRAGKLVVHHQLLSGGPQPIQLLDLSTFIVSTLDTTTDVGAIATGADHTFVTVSGTNTETLFGYANDGSAGTAVGLTGFAIASDDTNVYYPDFVSGSWTISKCPEADAAHGTCTPSQIVHPTSPVDFIDLRALRVESGALYAAGDGVGAASVWRIAL